MAQKQKKRTWVLKVFFCCFQQSNMSMMDRAKRASQIQINKRRRRRRRNTFKKRFQRFQIQAFGQRSHLKKTTTGNQNKCNNSKFFPPSLLFPSSALQISGYFPLKLCTQTIKIDGQLPKLIAKLKSCENWFSFLVPTPTRTFIN